MSALSITLEKLKSHVETFIQAEGQEIGGALHGAVNRFVLLVEGKQAEQDAIDLLTKAGYTINQPLVILPAPQAVE